MVRRQAIIENNVVQYLIRIYTFTGQVKLKVQASNGLSKPVVASDTFLQIRKRHYT